jgi:hypothetical protein
MFPEFSGSVIVPSLVSLPRLPRPSTGSPWGGFPAFVGTMSSSDFLRFFPPRSVSFAGRHLACALSSSLPCARTQLARAWALFREPPLFPLTRKALDLPGSWGTSACVPRSRTPVEPQRQVFLGASVLPSATMTASASTTRISRGSIPRPACSLSTLRSQSLPCATQDSLPAGDQPYRTGLYPPQGPSRRFQQCFNSSLPPPPSFPGAPQVNLSPLVRASQKNIRRGRGEMRQVWRAHETEGPGTEAREHRSLPEASG